jgi:hypothetical protein
VLLDSSLPSPSPGNLVKWAFEKCLLNEIMNQHLLNIRCYCNNWLGRQIFGCHVEFCGSIGMPLDIWRSGRVKNVVGFGHKRVRVGVGKNEQESLSLR